MTEAVPIIDLFAGPGGLGEGFTALRSDAGSFRIALSVEMDMHAHRTLELRAAFRVARDAGVAEAIKLYWEYLRTGDLLVRSRLISLTGASREVGGSPLALGKPNDDEEIYRLIRRAELNGNRPWVLIGGPPCQAYSIIGRSRMRGVDPRRFAADHRHVLYKEYLQIIRDFRPAIFVMENVKGLLTSQLEGAQIFDQILHDFRHAGYELRSLFNEPDLAGVSPKEFLVEAERFGIPQRRHRVFILGIREDLVGERGRSNGFRLSESATTATLSDAVGDLPAFFGRTRDCNGELSPELLAFLREAGRKARSTSETELSADVAARMLGVVSRLQAGSRPRRAKMSAWLKRKRDHFQTERTRSQLNHVPNHEPRTHIAEDLARYMYAACWADLHGSSLRLKHFPRSLMPNHANASKATKQSLFSDRFRVQVPDEPATTITSHISRDGHYFIHPDPKQFRSLTVREAARLQTFPDDYFFEGPRTSQYVQVGNAVPPLLASQIASLVLAILRGKAR